MKEDFMQVEAAIYGCLLKKSDNGPRITIWPITKPLSKNSFLKDIIGHVSNNHPAAKKILLIYNSCIHGFDVVPDMRHDAYIQLKC